MAGTVVLQRRGLTTEDVVAVARCGAAVELAAEARAGVAANRALVEQLAQSDEPVYGVSTGFGALAQTAIPREKRRQLQQAVVRSHAAGAGAPVEVEVVRAMMLLRARTLAMGYSGVRPVVVDALTGLLNAGVTPLVPEHGSLGASGDLAPLAHVSLCLLGEGEVLAPLVGPDDAAGPEDPESLEATERRVGPASGGVGGAYGAAEALRSAGLSPIVLEEKEGLALINGTDGMLGMLVLACEDTASLLSCADVAAAMSVEALLGTDRVFASELQALRPHPGQAASAANLTRLLAGSAIVASHRYDDVRVQDAYSMRCTPQVQGAARDTLSFARQVAVRELGSAVDNPCVLPDGRVESNGNFHGAPLAYACDFLAVALTDVASLAERRLDRLLDHTRSSGLPPFLAPQAGVHSGLMIAQYTAAALLAECRQAAYPSSVDSVPTSGMQEDHVSMGWTAARKLRRVVDHASTVIGIELLCAAAGLDLRSPLVPAVGTAVARDVVREKVAGPGPDRPLAADIAAVGELVRSGALLSRVREVVGPLR